MFKEYKAYKNELKNPPTGNKKQSKDRKFFGVFEDLMSEDVRVDGSGSAEIGTFVLFIHATIPTIF